MPLHCALTHTCSDYRAQHASEIQSFLDERTHLERSHHMLDETLEYVLRVLLIDSTNASLLLLIFLLILSISRPCSQAYATQSEFRSQREQLSGTLTRLTHVVAQMPGLNSIMTLISRRRRRDTIILAIIIGVCVVVLLLVGVRR